MGCNYGINIGQTTQTSVQIGSSPGYENHIMYNQVGANFPDNHPNTLISRNSFACNDAAIDRPSNNAAFLAPVINIAESNAIAGTGSPNSLVEVYAHGDASCTTAPCQGKTYLGTTLADAAGDWTLTAPFAATLNLGDQVVATATAQNNTSEFSACATVTAPATLCPNDSLVLVAFYHATDGDNWTNNTNWLVPGMPIGTWHGVTVNAEGCVTSIDLSQNQLDGQIPAAIGNLAQLTYLNLFNNALTGIIPNEMGSLLNLTELYLSINQLSGTIPSSLGTLSNLQVLDLSSLQLTGPIPPALSNLGNLQELYLFFNQLSGPLPDGLSSLTNLTTINLSSNQLTGCFPDGFLVFCNIDNEFTNNTGLPGGGDFDAFCTGQSPAITTNMDTVLCTGESLLLGGNTYSQPGEMSCLRHLVAATASCI
ncbi:MAG: hypothetical protein IPN76_26065 [Saprospiraceae bacterium]|nr:hypothetical protein [Saprospiraceae bacterium]